MYKMETKYDLLNQLYEDKRIKKSAKAIFQYLVTKGDAKRCYVSLKTIEEACSLTRRTVQNNIEKLCTTGYIIKKARWSHLHEQLSNDYIFNLSYIEELPAKTKDETDGTAELLFQYPKTEFTKMDYLKIVYTMQLSVREKMILTYFAHKANKHGISYNTVEVMCNQINCCLRTFSKAFKQLIKANVIKVQYIIKNATKIVVVSLNKEYLVAQKLLKEASQKLQFELPAVLGQCANACNEVVSQSINKRKTSIKEIFIKGIKVIKEVKRKLKNKIQEVKTELSRLIWKKLTQKPM